MRMLEGLKEVMDEIEIQNEWEFNFVSKILIQAEEHPQKKLTSKQFNCLLRIYDKYCKGAQ